MSQFTDDGLSQRPSVLVVDDSQAIRDLFRVFLDCEGYAYVGAENGRRAWGKVGESDISLIITDIEMPDWNGIRLIEEIRTADDDRIRRLPILVCSCKRRSKTVAPGGNLVGGGKT